MNQFPKLMVFSLVLGAATSVQAANFKSFAQKALASGTKTGKALVFESEAFSAATKSAEGSRVATFSKLEQSRSNTVRSTSWSVDTNVNGEILSNVSVYEDVSSLPFEAKSRGYGFFKERDVILKATNRDQTAAMEVLVRPDGDIAALHNLKVMKDGEIQTGFLGKRVMAYSYTVEYTRQWDGTFIEHVTTAGAHTLGTSRVIKAGQGHKIVNIHPVKDGELLKVFTRRKADGQFFEHSIARPREGFNEDFPSVKLELAEGPTVRKISVEEASRLNLLATKQEFAMREAAETAPARITPPPAKALQ